MPEVCDVVRAVLAPFVGNTVADTCVRATAISVGKTSDELTVTDLPALEERIRSLLAPIAPADTIDAMVADIKRGVE